MRSGVCELPQNKNKQTKGKMKGEMITMGHLGGYISGGDDATYYPDLWNWLVKDYGVRSVIDVGCGDGVAVRHFEKILPIAARGSAVIGIDGMPQLQPDLDITQWDYTTGPRHPRDNFDLVWSCEFVEHVVERCVPNFLATFACAQTVLMTHAVPGQAGHHHINCQTADYWRGAMAAIGYKLDHTLTRVTRELAAKNPSPWNHYKRSGLAFTRN